MAASDRSRQKSSTTLSKTNELPRSLESSRGCKSQKIPFFEISDNEMETSGKVDDPNDEDYEQSSQRGTSSTARPKSTKTKPKYDHLTKEALISLVKMKEEQHSEVKHKRAGERKEKDHEKKQRVRIQKENKVHLQTIEELKQRCRELRRQNHEQQQTFDAALDDKTERFADAQKDWLAKIDESMYHSHPDNVLRERFHELWTRCREWVKEWYKPQVSQDSRPLFHQIISRCASTQQSSAKCLLISKLDSGDTTTLRAMGFAWLTREMILCFFESPFFACGRGLWSLEEFYKVCKQKNLRKACAWRAETLRLIRDNHGVLPLELRNLSLKSEDLKSLCSSMVKKVTQNTHYVFLREITNEEYMRRQTSLDEICCGFCLLALELWCQKSMLVVVDNATLFQEAFSISSTLHQPHITMGYDEDDQRFDGVLPHAVLTPAIRIFGDANGDSLDQEKVISRSIILIPDESLQITTTSATVPVSNLQSQAAERKPGTVEDSFSQLSKKRKLSTGDFLLMKSTAGSSKKATSSSTSKATGYVRSPGQMESLDHQKSSLADILMEVSRGNTYETAQERLQVAAQYTQYLPVPTDQCQVNSSHPLSDRRADPDMHQPQNVSENEQPDEQQLGKRSPPGGEQQPTTPTTQSADQDASRSAEVDGDTIHVKLEETEDEIAEQQAVAGQPVAHGTDREIKNEPED